MNTDKKIPRIFELFKPPNLYFFLPGTILFLVFFVIPIIIMIRESFTKGNLIIEDKTFTFANYTKIFSSFYVEAFINSLVIGIIVTLLVIVISYPVARYYVDASGNKKKWLLIIIVSPLFINMVVRVYGWTILLSSTGAINEVLKLLNITDNSIQLMYNNLGVIIGMTHVFLPFMILSLTSSMENIKKNVYEGAILLGASRWKIFESITVPLTLPGLIAGSTLVFALTQGAFLTPLILGGDSVKIVSLLVHNNALVLYNWSIAASLAVGLVIIVLLVLWLQSYLTKKVEKRGLGNER